MLTKLASHLKAARLKKGLRLTDLTERTGINPTTLWRIEEGLCDPRLVSQLLPIAEELGLNLSSLLRKRTPTPKGTPR